MITSSLRHTQRHLRRIGKPSNNVLCSRFIFHYDNTTRFIASDASINSCKLLCHVSKRRNYNAISGTTMQQIRTMSDDMASPDTSQARRNDRVHANEHATIPYPIVINPYEDLPEIYSSPLLVLEHRNIKSVHRKGDCDSVTINNETWYTAAYETKFGGQLSGTFGELLQKINPTLANEELININGTNYYKTKEVAVEAAAARVLDLYSWSLKDGVKSLRDDDSVVALRYCVEDPEIKFTFKSSSEQFAWQVHAPINFLENCFRSVFGSTTQDCFHIAEVAGGRWYTATFQDPITSEVFHSGLVGPIDAEKRVDNALKPRLDEVEVRVKNGMVYYPGDRLARHAAAARAIDCYMFREGSDASTKKFQLCLEEPYSYSDTHAQRDDYEKLLLQRKRGRLMQPKKIAKVEGNSFKSIAESYAWQLHVPVNLLENCYRQIYGQMYPSQSFQCNKVTVNGREWFTATFKDPRTSEVFSSGLGRPITVEKKKSATLSTSLGEAEVHVMDGKVYYTEEKFARHAAAARAIDCFLHREGSDKLTKEYQLCLEDPYRDTTERDSGYNDYEELLRRRRDATYEKSDNKKFQGKPFSSFVKDNAFQLHVPMNLVKSILRTRGPNEYRTEEVIIESIRWRTATFTDPNTSEVFPAGIGRHVDVKKKEGAFISPSFDEVQNRVVDGKVYYREKKHATNAAAARVVDCYLYRETGEFSKNQLCLEDPYEEGDVQEIDYDALTASKSDRSVMSFKSIAKLFTYQLHVPVNLIEKCYRQIYGQMYPNESFQCDSVMANGREWFTSTFKDPRTSEVFSSGLGRPITVEKKKSATLSTSLGEAEVHVMDGKVYYTEEKFARHAAAARAIDCFLHREGSDKLTKEYQLCLEDPYRDTTERDSGYNDYEELLRRRREFPSKEKYYWKLHIPLAFLKSYLPERFGSKYSTESFHKESIVIGNRTWHTATFTDPNTSEVFPAGIVGPINAEKKEAMVLSPPLDEAEVRISDGKVYYAEYNDAKHAAAARAIDCYFYRDNKELQKYQLCLEDPYSEGGRREIDYGDLVASRDNAKSLDSVEDLMPYLDESDEDFTIVSRTYSDQPIRVDHKLSTLGRIAEIWAEIPTNASVGNASAKTASFVNSSRDPTENILNWFKRVDHTPSNFEQAMAFSQLCNKTLLALANENTENTALANENTENSYADCVEIQTEAKFILDKLTSISSQFAAKDESIVNAETLNAYIQCLSRSDHGNDVEESATVAEELLKRMSEGEDNLPSPNTGTYNAVMKLWSLVYGEKGKNGVNDTFSLLQNAAVAKGDLCPNRDSFLILLAANAKENDRFKYDLAISSLERIKALSQDLCGEAYVPDTEDYNAALKKIDHRYPPWFWHGQQHGRGFKALDDDEKCEALDMEKWLDHAEEMGASPSDDMYFEVIKAWASTGSLEGLIGGDGAYGAEELAKKAVLRSNGAPNMKMVYPIITAWSLCGEKLGPDRVKEWIDQISLLGMKPDLDLQVAYFVAVEKWQSKLIANLQTNNDGKKDERIVEKSVDIESLFKAAQNCTRYLEEMASDKNRQDIADLDAFTSILRYSIKAWSRASHSTLLLPGSTPLDATQGVEEMAKVLKRISLRNHGQDLADVDEALVNAAGKVFTEFTSQLRKLDSTRNEHFENNEKCHFADRIADVESSLRSYEFHSRRLASDDKLLPESNDIRHNMYKETLRGCAGVKKSIDCGHVMRICTLIMDCLSWHHEQTPRDHGSGKEAEDITYIYSDIAMISGTCVKNSYERMNVLRSIYARASDFFPKKNPHHESSYARVDRATLLGSMRRSLGDSEMTDSFLSSFEEGKQGQRRRSRQRGSS